jgi:alpha-glucosidase
MAVDVQEADPDSLLWAYRRFLSWRRTMPALRHGNLRPLAVDEPLVGFTRETDQQAVLAVFNLSDQPAAFDLGRDGAWRPETESGFAPPSTGSCVELPPYGALFASRTLSEAMREGVLETV